MIDWIRSSSLGIEDCFNHVPTAYIKKICTAKQKVGEEFKAHSHIEVINEVVKLSEKPFREESLRLFEDLTSCVLL